MTRIEMLNAMIEHYSGGNKSHFAKIVGVKPQTINTWLTRNSFDAELLYSKLRGINAGWLLSGEGSMLNEDSQNANKYESTLIMYIERLLKEKEELIMNQNIEIGRLNERLRNYEEIATKKAI